MSAAMQYSNPPLMLSGSSPFQNPGAGSEVTTVSSPSSAVSLHLPERTLVDRDVAVAERAATAARSAVVAARGRSEHEYEGQQACSELVLLAHVRPPQCG